MSSTVTIGRTASRNTPSDRGAGRGTGGGARAGRQPARRQILPDGARAWLVSGLIRFSGAVLMALALAFTLALLSWNPLDPSFNRATAAAPANWLGLVGAYASDLALQSLGLASAVLAGVVGLWGWRVMRVRSLGRLWLRLASLPAALIAAAAALSALGAPFGWPFAVGLGGAVGWLVLDQSATLLGGFGLDVLPLWPALAWATLAIAAIATTSGLSAGEWRRIAAALGRGIGTAGLFLGHALWRAVTAFGRLLGAPLRGARARHGTAPARAPTRARQEPRFVAGKEPSPDPAGRHDQDADEDDDVPLAAPVSRREPELVAPRPATARGGRRRAREQQPALDLDFEAGLELPTLDLLSPPPPPRQADSQEALAQNARLLESVLADFGVKGEIVKVRPGPVVTLYELEPAPGTKTSRVIALADDIARSMSAISVRIAVVPGRNVIGVELPNADREMVGLSEMLAADSYDRSSARLPLALGKDIGGQPLISDLSRMPHLLVAGTTGSGKSVAINTMILSLLYRLTPEQCRFIMVDPKMLELSVYEGIPHLLSPVVTDPRKAVVALKWTVREMENRYRAMSLLGVRNLAGYNARLAEARDKGEALTRKVQTGFDPETGKPIHEDQPLDMAPMPYIVVIIDEMADLMLVAGKDVEAAIQRLAQMARAAGIHLIMATQRPSVDVVTGTIKANFPYRISFQVTSKIDSRTILGEPGAEQLLGQGDMLFMEGGGRLTRVHAPFVSVEEVEAVVSHLTRQGVPDYLEEVTEDEDAASGIPGFDDGAGGAGGDGDGGDTLYDQAVALVAREGKASTSFVQRHLQIGYNRAARIIEQMENEGVIGQANHVGKREVLIGER
ncbi:MAG: DNA translocase FtsK 4TM domain-containing protein [Alphaproteobacteria bacterium]